MAKQKIIPEIIGGAKSLFIAESGEPFAVVGRDGEKIDIVYLALCKTERPNEYYVFGCDNSFNTFTDHFFDALENALEDVAGIYKLEKINWRPLIPGMKISESEK